MIFLIFSCSYYEADSQVQSITIIVEKEQIRSKKCHYRVYGKNVSPYIWYVNKIFIYANYYHVLSPKANVLQTVICK